MAMTKTIPLAQYLFSRLKQLDCHSIHGVSGDFMLRALDFLPASKMRWIGNANELCAGYAADGFARAAATARLSRTAGHHQAVPPQVGAVFTTYGVGELSAINAIAGSYAECVPVVHIVGTPSRKHWTMGACVHHSLRDGNTGVYAEMAKQITCAQADLSYADPQEAAHIYDEAIAQGMKSSRPVYVKLPSDCVSIPVPTSLLSKPLNLHDDSNHPAEQARIISIILSQIHNAERPIIIADGLSYACDFVDELNEVVRLTAIPAMCYSAGKGVIDESLPSWRGPLTGPTEMSKSADLALLFGPLLSDTNTAAWTAVPNPEVSISFGLDQIIIGSEVHQVRSKPLLEELVRRLKENSTLQRRITGSNSKASTHIPSNASRITQDDFWKRMSFWLKPHDTILLANGTPLIGGRDIHLPTPTRVIASGIWCSIGQMLPASQGVAAAKQDLQIPGRTILFEGDESFQVTCQSLSDIIRYRLDVTIFMANNAGYAYERWLNGMEAEYNDVAPWRYTEAARFFAAPEDSPQYPVIPRKVETWSELEDVLADERIAGDRGLKLIDVSMAPDDVPSTSKAGLLQAGEALRAS